MRDQYHTSNYKRNIDGILLMDKPVNISSNNFLQKVKKIFFAKKAGYAGTLDPMATGMLPVCFGKATKISQYIINQKKKYQVIAKFGKRTDTSDSEGNIIDIRPIKFNKLKLLETLNKFIGYTLQVPSMFSSIKHCGKPLYKYARNGITIKRKNRLIYIYSIKLLKFKFDECTLEICCSKGTYIRTVIDDLGEKLGCGAYANAIRRLSIGNFPSSSMITIENLLSIFKNQSNISKDFSKLDSFLLSVDSFIKNHFNNYPNN